MLNLSQIELDLDNAHRKAAQGVAHILTAHLGPRPQTIHVDFKGILMVDGEPWWAGPYDPVYGEIQTTLNNLQEPTLAHLTGVRL